MQRVAFCISRGQHFGEVKRKLTTVKNWELNRFCDQEVDRARLKVDSVFKLANAFEFVSGEALAANFVWSPAASASPLSHCGIEPRMTRLLDL